MPQHLNPEQPDSIEAPTGSSFLLIIKQLQNRCEAQSVSATPTLGKKAPLCFEHLGTVLSFLDQLASCLWGCKGGDHLIEYLAARSLSTGEAGFRLACLGHYDEALALARAVGEVANLLWLFGLDAKELSAWKSGVRMQPAEVRTRIEKLGDQPPISRERYQLLCERAAHVTPRTTPQAHNPIGMPVGACQFQEQGFIVCLNELAIPLSFVLGSATQLLAFDQTIRNEVSRVMGGTADVVGNAQITEIDDYHAEIRRDPEVAARLDKLTAQLKEASRPRVRSRPNAGPSLGALGGSDS